MARLERWDIRLGDLLMETRDLPFEWGVHDCVLFSGRAVEAITGVNPAHDLIGTYSTRIGALAALSAAGYASLPEAFAALVGPSKPVAFAQRGDLVTFGDFTSAVVDLSGEFALGLDETQGFLRIPVLDADMAFTVG